MLIRIKFFLISLFFLLVGLNELHATHYRAGEISYVQLSDLTIEVTLTTYTKTSSASADSDSIEIDWGDGFKETIGRTILGGTNTSNDVKISYFKKKHTYPGKSTYTIGFSDPNRTANILNVNWPNSIDTPFFISSTFTLLDTQFQGKNSSAILLQPPIDIACLNRTFIHNPNAYDPDGDSLSYELVTPLASKGEEVPFYKLPSQISPGLNNVINLNPLTGNLTWERPQIQGEYNIAIRINEYRKGVLINSMMRDMQILVRACMNEPPEIVSIEEICVFAGEEVIIDLAISDPDTLQKVKLTGTGGIFELEDSNATIDVDPIYFEPPYNAQFRWKTTCNDIKDDYYQVVLRAVDDYLGDSGLATLKTIRIKVIGPSPIVNEISIVNESINLQWQSPYSCELAENNYFQGFAIWRKEGPGLTLLDSCANGIGDSNYQLVKPITIDQNSEGYFYLDNDVEPNKSYCYRVVAEFALLTYVGFPFNRVSSRRSEELCATISGNVPLITKVSVLNTDINQGSIEVNWIPPSPLLLDTMMFPGPYSYVVSYSLHGENNFEEIVSSIVTSNSLMTPDQFVFTHNGLNTTEQQYDYKVDFHVNGEQYFDTSIPASSLRLEIQPRDEELLLNWSSVVPWINTSYHVYKFDKNLNSFIWLDSTLQATYLDENLEDGKEYCYLIEAHGEINDGIRMIDTIINRSQENCAIPVDNEPPCSPVLNVESICDKEGLDITREELANHLFWTAFDSDCDMIEELESFNIYYKESISDSYVLVANLSADMTLIYDHFPETTLAGCYVVTAIDDKLNESEYSNEICVNNCALYELPNTFTPNGDSQNDLFVPINNYFISQVDFKLYNRWGTMIFNTTDPMINWDGKNDKGKEMSPGVYYYSCKAFHQSVESSIIDEIELNGVVHLIRNR